MICRAGRRNPRLRHDGNRELVTDIETVNAAGDILLPFIIFKGGIHRMGWYSGFVKEDDNDVKFAYSPKGYSSDILGMDWLVDHFYPLALNNRHQNFRFFCLLMDIALTSPGSSSPSV